MIGVDDLVKGWKEQQEAWWSILNAVPGTATQNAANLWTNWSPAEWFSAASGAMDPASFLGAPFPMLFSPGVNLADFLSTEAKRLGDQELGPEQIRHLSDYWVGLLHISTTKAFADGALNVATVAEAWQETIKLNPLVSGPAEVIEDLCSAWKATLASYVKLLGLYGGYSQAVADHLVAEVEGHEAEIKSIKELFELWLASAEAVHDDITRTPEYRRIFGQFVNDLGQAVQKQRSVVDQNLERVGLPTYSELSDVHVRIQGLRKDRRRFSQALKSLREEMAGLRSEADRLVAVVSTLEAATQEREAAARERDELKDRLGRLESAFARLAAEVPQAPPPAPEPDVRADPPPVLEPAVQAASPRGSHPPRVGGAPAPRPRTGAKKTPKE